MRFAMLSVYYDCLRREGSLGAAPAILLPLSGGTLSLEEALAAIREDGRGDIRAAVWRIVRATPVGSSYPSALKPFLAQVAASLDLDELTRLRKALQAGANLLGSALVACLEGQSSLFTTLLAHMASLPSDFDDATEAVLGMTASDFLKSLTDPNTPGRLKQLQDDVGLDLYQYAAEFADAAAFGKWWQAGDTIGADEMIVYPAASVIQQDLRSMITRVTVTTLVRCKEFAALVKSADPQYWALVSDVLARTRYVKDCFTLTPVSPAPPGPPGQSGGSDPYAWLEEQVNVPSSIDGPVASSFHNVLRIDKFTVVPDKEVTVEFSLGRAIDSSVLWDKRSGGLLVDQGYIKVRHIAGDHWRLTSHKTLLFSDRTPNMNLSGWFDLGQTLNLLAPAALSWWLESETYSITDPQYSPQSKGASDGGSE
ncbi:MAG: hypothetical protein JO244_13345 [Solirubrobacterales bacterium]|nr:hypothetical protein [Solirubrobacterales bacterium]